MIYSLYDGSVKLYFDEAKHVYSVDNVIVPSVTGVTSIIDKSGPLMWWAAGQVVEFFEGKLDLVGDMDEVQRASLIHDARRAHLTAGRQAADIGTLAHQWIEDYLADKSPAMPRNKKLKATITSFLKWHETHPLTPYETEFKCYHKAQGYAGTCDYDGMIGKERCIADWKTGRAVYPEHRLQTMAYKAARELELGITYDARWVIVLPKDGGEVIAERIGPEHDDRDWQGFTGALALYRSIKEQK